MGIVLAKNRLVKFFKALTVSQVIREKWRLVQAQESTVYLGHKIYYDQNEKLGTHGAAHVCASDGYSGMIVEFALISTKNLYNNTRSDLSAIFFTILFTFIIPLLFMLFFNSLDI